MYLRGLNSQRRKKKKTFKVTLKKKNLMHFSLIYRAKNNSHTCLEKKSLKTLRLSLKGGHLKRVTDTKQSETHWRGCSIIKHTLGFSVARN